MPFCVHNIYINSNYMWHWHKIMMNYWKTYVNMVGMKGQINMCLFMSISVACVVGWPKFYHVLNWFFLPKLGFLDFIWTWAPCCFNVLVTMNCFLRKDIYVILIHILERERYICCLWSFVNVFAFVSKHIDILWDQI